MAFQKRNNQPQKQNNYFTQNIQRSGENFLDHKRAIGMESDAIRMFRDLARGYIDVRLYEKYFLDPQFLSSCIHAAHLKFVYFNVSFIGVEMFIQSELQKGMQVDQLVQGISITHKKCADAYSIIFKAFTDLQMTQDIGVLFKCVAELKPYKYNV